jgi:hypothetical protein
VGHDALGLIAMGLDIGEPNALELDSIEPDGEPDASELDSMEFDIGPEILF